jgi:hypothetical protein
LEFSWCRVSFLKGDLQFSKFLKNTICIGLCKLKCTEKRFIPLTPLLFLPEFVPHTEFKGRPEMPSRMYSTIQLLEIMRRSAFTSPLSYPFLLGVEAPPHTTNVARLPGRNSGQKAQKGPQKKKFLAEFWLILPKTGRKGAAENFQKKFLIFSCDNCDKFDF